LKTVLNYGGGTQSTGLLLMLLDEGNPPDLTIFADTGAEPYFVYDYIELVREYVKTKYGYHIVCVGNRKIDHDIRYGNKHGRRFASIPVFTSSGVMLRRQCTNEYKIQPIERYIKGNFDIGRKTRKNSTPKVNMLMGISLDEIERVKESRHWWAVNKYPLVERRMYRHEVIDYINKYHTELKDPPRSSCYFCPYHSNNYWRWLKQYSYMVFEDACDMDDTIRDMDKLDDKFYIHRSLKPLRGVDFSTHGQLEIFGECDGYCGI